MHIAVAIDERPRLAGRIQRAREAIVPLLRGNAAPLGVLLAGLALRLALVALGWPATDSDEATMGLMARHIAYHGAHPIFFYGQNYMGALEAYLAAGFFRLFGPSVFTLRLGNILMSTGFLACMYLLTRLLYTRGWALFTLALLIISTPETLYRQLWVGGGYDETLFLGSLMLLLAAWLALPRAHARGAGDRWRLAAFAGWGLASGLGLWSDFLIAPFVLASGLLLAITCWPEIRRWGGAAALLTLLLGAAPLIVFAITAPTHNPFADTVSMQQSVVSPTENRLALAAVQIVGTVTTALPTVTGTALAFPLGSDMPWPFANIHNVGELALSILRGLWGLGYLALIAVGAIRAVRAVRVVRSAWVTQSASDAAARNRSLARLALLAAAVLTLAFYASSPVATYAPNFTARYLTALTIALPAVLAPLWGAWGTWSTWGAWGRALRPFASVGGPTPPAPFPWGEGGAGRIARIVALALIALVLAVNFGRAMGTFPATLAGNQQQMDLIAHLERLDATYIYTDYWTCDRIAFLSDERITCAVLRVVPTVPDSNLTPVLQFGKNRYQPYVDALAATPYPAFVFPANSDEAASFAEIAHGNAPYNLSPSLHSSAFDLYILDGYVIYIHDFSPF